LESSIVFPQPIEVLGDCDADENVFLVHKEPLEVVGDAAGEAHLEEKAPLVDAYLQEGHLQVPTHHIPLGV
jgi:hypothetical protein